jgi:hypothetical protein
MVKDLAVTQATSLVPSTLTQIAELVLLMRSTIFNPLRLGASGFTTQVIDINLFLTRRAADHGSSPKAGSALDPLFR